MTAYRTQLRNALAQIIVQLPQALIPTATFASPVAAGATSFDTGSAITASLFREDGTVTFWDGSGEFPVIVQSVSGSVVTCKFTGRFNASGNPITGFVYPHSAGALVATNLLLVPGNPRDASTVSPMLGNGYPVIRIFAPDMQTDSSAIQQVQPAGMASLVYQLPLRQVAVPALQTDLWLQQQGDRADRDMGIIIDALVDNFRLIVAGTENAELLKQFRQAGRQNHLTDSIPLYEDYMDIVVLGPRQDITD